MPWRQSGRGGATGSGVKVFTHVSTLDAGVPHLQGVTDLEVFWLANGPVLYSASEANGGLAAFDRNTVLHDNDVIAESGNHAQVVRDHV